MEGLIWLFGVLAMLQLKPRSACGACYHLAFMGNHYAYVFSLIHPVDSYHPVEFFFKGMRTWGQPKISSCV